MIKLYYKIVREHRKSILTYMVIFIVIFSLFAIFSNELSGNTAAIYEQEKANVTILDEDQSELSKVVIAQLEKEHNVLDFGDTMEDMKDALFFSQIDCIIEIPKGFENGFQNAKDNLVNLQARADDASSTLIMQHLNSYLSSLRTYHTLNPSLNYNEIGKSVATTLKHKASIHFQKAKATRESDYTLNYYYNFLSYILFSILVMTAASAMQAIYRSEIRKRTLISPYHNTKMNLQILLSNISFGVLIWAVFTIAIVILRRDGIFTQAGLIYIANSFIFMIMCISFAYMITAFTSNKKKGRDKLDMITTLVGLVSSFLGGAFLPLTFIPSNIQTISKFLPTYWYVRLNDLISSMTSITSKIGNEIVTCIGIQLLFIIAFLAIGLMIMKNNRTQDVIIDNDFE